MRKVMMTGAGGFIGRHLVSYLKNHGYWARGVDVIHEEALLELIACLSLFLVVLFFRFGWWARNGEIRLSGHHDGRAAERPIRASLTGRTPGFALSRDHKQRTPICCRGVTG
jgi:NAD-dependent epimerase/dehydratase family protein